MLTPDAIRAGYHALGAVRATVAGGVEFAGLFDVADRTAFDAVQVGDFTLRYLTADAPALTRGSVLTIEGAQYEVAERPARINAAEALAALIEHDEPEAP